MLHARGRPCLDFVTSFLAKAVVDLPLWQVLVSILHYSNAVQLSNWMGKMIGWEIVCDHELLYEDHFVGVSGLLFFFRILFLL